jgi:NHLM bacteriocin system ABC transporter ATP-binding protein
MTDRAPEQRTDDSRLELFLLRLRYREGRLIPLEANSPLYLVDPEIAYIVYAGRVDIFAARMRDGKPVAPRHHLLRVQPGEIMFGMHFSVSGEAVGLLATGVPDTTVISVKRHRLQEIAGEPDSADMVAAMLDRWIGDLTAGVLHALMPKDTAQVDPGVEVELLPSATVTSRNGLVWVKLLAGGALFADRDDVPSLPSNGPFPLSSSAWLRATTAEKLETFSTTAFMTSDPEWEGLNAFHDLAVALIRRNIVLSEGTERERLQQKVESDRASVESVMMQIAAVMNPEISALAGVGGGREPLLAACRMVAEATGIDFTKAVDVQPPEGEPLSVSAVARVGGFRYREVALDGQWWTRNNGALLGFQAENGRPVALLPRSKKAYELHDPLEETVSKVTPEIAASLLPKGFMFYRPFPPKALGIRDLLKFGARSLRPELSTILAMGVLGGLLGLLIPITTQVIFDRVIPTGDRTQLVAIGFFLFAVAVATALFQIVRSIAVLRVEGLLDAAVQSAVWDRVLALPVPFFRDYSAGDLGNRAMGFTQMRLVLTGPVLTMLLTAVFSSFNLVLLFIYSVPLALFALLIIIVAMTVTATLGYLSVRHQRILTEIEGQISGLVLQIINGISKFRVAGAEDRAFGIWGERFAAQRRVAYRARQLQNYILVFNSAYAVVASVGIFALYAAAGGASLTTGQFIAFFTAFTTLLLIGLQLTGVFVVILGVVPLYERMKPILNTLPEVDNSKTSPGVLSGDIEVSHITFRYAKDGPTILNDVSIAVRPGEMVALVGPSGSGKSSLLRLLMGFEQPESGAVYYNGQDLASLNVEEVRRQIGTVIQSGKVMAGAILTNIIGSSLLTIDDAWEAARMAGLGADIKQMPMGMHTLVNEEGGTFSGGQRQRLLIARAIAHRPRILFFDEATSALDNVTQEIVSKSLEELNTTRVIIAHRLSTIVNADRIYVMQNGRVVQTGTYSELLQTPGLFAELARRQIV